ncbi:SPFH domain-containing protein [Aestuariirhabdus sp. Z084]|uniref:SPFH domain-containing protein n=1 Tax=Aestuariirhabdus haliotis TaxID=2918751 RepID=UPI00201B40DA|nr:SPFH domain-containing protein [Aestuariirhabdus haliotis]MCL6417719.1 SPFH domain-containing protein [Aestuariirhabdus haliotis]MCL6421650.1 SPFH domain-containing protein [Aestuariirhabdus haliotis]
MFGIKYFKADSSTYVVKSVDGQVRRKGKGLSFFYNAATTSIAAIPVNAQDVPYIFNLQTADFQSVKVQGQVTYQIVDADKVTEMLNFNLGKDGISYVSEDPLKLSDRVVRSIQTLVQTRVQAETLRNTLGMSQRLVELIRSRLTDAAFLQATGLGVSDVAISAISPTPETARALEAEAREAILKQADDAIYARRKSAVEQEFTIKEAELETELSVQQKEQEIAESRLANEREILRGQTATERERLQAKIDAENQRNSLVSLSVSNQKMEAEAEAYSISTRMKAFKELPVDNLKALALANMQPEQMMAMAFDSLAQNAGKIGELNIAPDMFNQLARKVKGS